MTRICLMAMGGVVLCLGAPGPALADAIYGCWSFGAERLVVEHDGVITPGGAQPSAQVDRHNAVYVAPEDERDAGRVLEFRQLNHGEVARRARDEGGQAVGEVEIWRPCRDLETS